MAVKCENKQFITSSEGFCGADCRKDQREFDNALEGGRESRLKEAFAVLLNTFGETEQVVLKLRFGLDGNKPATCAEIATCLSLEPKEVRRVCGIAIRKLRHPARRKALLYIRSKWFSAGDDAYNNLIAEVFGRESI